MGAGINRLPDGSEILRKFNRRCKDANYPDIFRQWRLTAMLIFFYKRTK